jgi:hypothetical protein
MTKNAAFSEGFMEGFYDYMMSKNAAFPINKKLLMSSLDSIRKPAALSGSVTGKLPTQGVGIKPPMRPNPRADMNRMRDLPGGLVDLNK